MHVTDWLPTLLEASQDQVKNLLTMGLNSIDGVSQWKHLLKSGKGDPHEISARTEMLYNIDPLFGSEGVEQDVSKLRASY